MRPYTTYNREDMKRIRWTCDACGAVHHYMPVKCCRCEADANEDEAWTLKEEANNTFNEIMEEIERWQIPNKKE